MNSADSFSATYDEARTKFLAAVTAAQGKHERFEHPTKAPDGKDISTDVAWFGDGRITAGHFAVLRRIPARVVAVDEPVTSPDPGARDAAMAANVERALRAAGGPVLFVAGNLHTRLRTHEHYRPAGAYLARDRPGLSALDIHYARGRFFNCGPRTFPPAAAPPPRPHLVVPEATEAVVPRRRTAPRAPA